MEVIIPAASWSCCSLLLLFLEVQVQHQQEHGKNRKDSSVPPASNSPPPRYLFIGTKSSELVLSPFAKRAPQHNLAHTAGTQLRYCPFRARKSPIVHSNPLLVTLPSSAWGFGRTTTCWRWGGRETPPPPFVSTRARNFLGGREGASTLVDGEGGATRLPPKGGSLANTSTSASGEGLLLLDCLNGTTNNKCNPRKVMEKYHYAPVVPTFLRG